MVSEHPQTYPRFGSGVFRIRALAQIFDRLYSEQHKKAAERWVVGISVVGFVTHLAHVFLARNWANPPAIIAAAGTDYVSAIATPFSFILFYEVLVLISAVPESTTQSIAKQFEIVSLIFIRGFFKDIAKLDIENLRAQTGDLIPAFVEGSAGLLMFLLVTAFRHAAARREKGQSSQPTEALARFIERKKLLALGLTVLFVSLAVRSILDYAMEVYGEAQQGIVFSLAPPTTFYSDVFTVMIFTDVLILILSLLVSDSYEMVFRNAAFVISTILIRFSLTAAHPYGALLGLAGMVFGIATVLIYNYSSRIRVAT